MANYRTRMARGDRSVVPPAVRSCGEMVRYFRLRAGMQQGTLAVRAGITQSALSKVENDQRRYVRESTILAIVGALGLDAQRAADLMSRRVS